MNTKNVLYVTASTFLLSTGTAYAQTPPTTDISPKANDLPEFIAIEKKMSEASAAKKREGFFATGVPYFSADPLNGFGVGATGYLFFNGDRNSSLFAYKPYDARLGLSLQQSIENSQSVKAKLDMPYILDSPWRLRLDGVYSRNPNNVYFGLTEKTLDRLPGGTYDAYKKQLEMIRPATANETGSEVADVLKNRFLEQEWMINLKGERVILDGNWRLMAGYELQHLSYQTFEGSPVTGTDPLTGATRQVPNGASLLQEDANAKNVYGEKGGLISILQTALIYDTRDFEPDPTRGIVAEFSNEFSAPFIGSDYFFDKALLQFKHYYQLFPEIFPRTILASRVGYCTIFGDQAPFFEYQDQWSPDGSINALGGSQTLRGFKANRLLGRTVGFGTLELRHKVGEVDFWGQNLSLAVVPFVDIGTVGDQNFMLNLLKMRAAAGVGLRLGWNLSTIVTLDFAVSEEDQQWFLNFNNSF